MASINVYTAERSQAIEDKAVVTGAVDDDGNLTLTTNDGTAIAAGNVKGPTGDPGPAAPPASETTAGIVQLATAADVAAGTDDTKAVTPAALQGLSGGALQEVVTFAAGSYNFNKSDYPGLKMIRITGVAGGGGGGGVPAAASTAHSTAGGGGAGGAFMAIIQASDLADTTAFVVGAGGTAGTSTATGGTGGTTSFGAFASAAGGVGAIVGLTNTLYVGGLGGNGGSASVTTPAQGITYIGEAGTIGTGLNTLAVSGAGGASIFGAGGAALYTGAGSTSGAGNPAPNPGAGGGGAYADSSGPAANGGVGGAGQLNIEIYV
jgi:hypothetical protein